MEKLKQFLSSFKKKPLLTVAFTALIGTGYYYGRKPTQVDTFNNADLKSRSVKIVNFNKNSGGSGSIISSSYRESTILTNNHVCEVVVNGGLVIAGTQEYAVTSFKRSKRHDLCLITVGADLGINTKIADRAPDLQEEAAVSGHPRLLPNVVTRGHFSDKQIISIMTGIRACTEKDMESPNMLLCFFLGGIPEITTYEAQVVTAYIQGGSSGSPVYNSAGEISAVVFAGSGDISQAYVVPYEAVATFFDEELKNLETQLPNTTLEYQPRQRRSVTRTQLKSLCEDSKGKDFKVICSVTAISGEFVWKN